MLTDYTNCVIVMSSLKEKRSMVNGKKARNLTIGSITLGLLWFAVPMILGNLLQQFYDIADALIVGGFLADIVGVWYCFYCNLIDSSFRPSSIYSQSN